MALNVTNVNEMSHTFGDTLRFKFEYFIIGDN
jgi:hypothetical protein